MSVASETPGGVPCLYFDCSIFMKRHTGYCCPFPAGAACVGVAELAFIRAGDVGGVLAAMPEIIGGGISMAGAATGSIGVP